MTYDAANQMTRVVNYTSTNAVLTDFDYARDAVGNPTRVVEANGDRVTYSYDATYQLSRERRSGANAYDTTYLYDAGGNRRAKIDSAARTTSVYDGANQLRYSLDATGRTTYTFDASGNQLVTLTPAGARTTNTWDFENRLTKVKLPTGVVNTMTYSGDNLRVQKIDSAGTAKFIWDGQNVLMETDAANASNAVYTARPAGYGSMLSQRRKSGAVWTPSYYHFDQLGTVAALTSSAQAVTDTYKYRAFGEALATTGTTKNAFRYVGALQYYFDPDQAQYYVRRRVYQPTIARWLSADPLGRSVGFNRFSYCGYRVTVAVDPSGLRHIICYCGSTGRLETDCADEDSDQDCCDDACRKEEFMRRANVCGVSSLEDLRKREAEWQEFLQDEQLSLEMQSLMRQQNKLRWLVDAERPGKCGVPILLLTGEWCVERSVWDGALDGMSAGVNCWWECMIETNLSALGCAPIVSGGSLTCFTHWEVKKPPFIRRTALSNPKKDITTMQSILAYYLNRPGRKDLPGHKLMRSGCHKVSSHTFREAVKSSVAGFAIVESAYSIYCGLHCLK